MTEPRDPGKTDVYPWWSWPALLAPFALLELLVVLGAMGVFR